MFTGIIEEVGKINRIEKQGNTMRLTIGANKVLEDVNDGDSIAVNGVCLTVVSFVPSQWFAADVMPETFYKTALAGSKVGDAVNLERAMAADGRFGGHIVQGHVDGTGKIVSRKANENAVLFTIEVERADLFDYMLPQGSVTLDGISLTLVTASQPHITVSIIPHTIEHTNLKSRQMGDKVNIECDILGKYIKHLLFRQGQGKKFQDETLNAQFLKEHGFV